VELSPIFAPLYVQQEDLLSQLRSQFNFEQNELKLKDNNSSDRLWLTVGWFSEDNRGDEYSFRQAK
jgi:hypothetical protein